MCIHNHFGNCDLDEITFDLDEMGKCINYSSGDYFSDLLQEMQKFRTIKVTTKLKVKLDDGAYMPERAHATDAGYDLRTPRRVVLVPLGNVVVRTGVHIQLPPGKCAIVISKSGLYVKHNISSTGLVDEGYTGEVIVNLLNHSGKIHIFEPGDKISQFMITDYYGYELVQVDELEESERGDSGFGSTGK
jgi:dUTP pyrophosphatase